jgi:hypothetical protein
MIRRATNYQQELGALIYESLMEFALPVKDKTILLKPNLVGPDPLGVMNTHPAVIAAACESFLRLGAAEVLIGDGPAMDRDTEAILESVRLKEFVGSLARRFVDLCGTRAAGHQGFAAEGVVFPPNCAGGRSRSVYAKVENASLGRRDAFAQEYVRHRARKLLRVAQKRIALGGHR